MKFSLLALALGLASAPVFAVDGQISFIGQVVNGTCTIEVVDPVSQDPQDRIDMGIAQGALLTATGDTSNPRPFELKINSKGTCATGTNKKATITFETPYANTSATGFSLNQSIPGAAKGVELGIKDNRTNAFVTPGIESDEFDLDTATEVHLGFTAMYVRNATAISPGPAEADVNMTITPN